MANKAGISDEDFDWIMRCLDMVRREEQELQELVLSLIRPLPAWFGPQFLDLFMDAVAPYSFWELGGSGAAIDPTG